MRTDQDFEVIKAMETYGGSFVKALAECFYRADSINFNKLKAAFSEYWKGYAEMAEDQKEKVQL